MEITNINEIYYSISLFSAIVILTLGVILATLRFPEGKVWNKPRAARIYLSASYLLLATGNIMEYFQHSSAEDLLLMVGITAIVSSFQALLFTATLLALIQPSYVRRDLVLKQIFLIVTIGSAILTAISMQWLPEMLLFGLILGLYISQLTCYTMLFRRKYAECISTLEDYYDEEQDARLKWVKIGFYSALSIGILGITAALVGMWLYITFIILYTIFYTWTVIQFNNFRLWAEAVVPVVSTITNKDTENKEPEEVQITEESTEAPSVLQGKEDELRIKLEKWVAQKRYKIQDESVEEIATQLGTDKTFLRSYFSTHMNTNFRSWRSELRIEEAKRLIREHPEYSLSQIAEIIGFNHRGNFYIQFQKIVGMTATEYRENFTKRQKD